MKPTSDPPSASPGSRADATSGPARTGNETQVIDLADVEVLVAQHAAESARQLEGDLSERSLPPALPPPLPESELARASQVAPPPPRRTAFYVIALLAFLVLGIGGGLAIAMTMRARIAPAPSAAASGATGPSVITIPTVEVDDDTSDAGK
ncbi:MAG: hypothetical protein JWP97_4572 [Labilithrix sp.]|nr:hypothetical protein [Labilithrix sp.]